MQGHLYQPQAASWCGQPQSSLNNLPELPFVLKASVGLDHVEHFIFCAIGELTSIFKK